MAIFEPAIEVVLGHEGERYTDDPADPGGPTRWGITLATYRALWPRATAADVRALTRAEALEVYRALWWRPLCLDLVVDQVVATKILDVAVNLGQRRGLRLVQRALCSLDQEVVEDGRIGPATLSEVNAARPRELVVAIGAEQAEHYRRRIARRPALGKYRRGWMTRAAWPYPGRAALIA